MSKQEQVIKRLEAINQDLREHINELEEENYMLKEGIISLVKRIR